MSTASTSPRSGSTSASASSLRAASGAMIYTNGEYFDDLIFGITAEEFWARHPVRPL